VYKIQSSPANLQITVFWDMKLRKLVDGYHCCWGNCCHHVQSERVRRASLVLALMLAIIQSTHPTVYS